MNGVAGAFPAGGAAAIEIGQQKAALSRGDGSATWTPKEWCERFRELADRVVHGPPGDPCWHCHGEGFLGGGGGDALCDTCEGTGQLWPVRAPRCARCHGVEWIALVPNAAVGHPAFGKAGPCPACQGGHGRRMLVQADVPPKYHDGFTFETLAAWPLTESQGDAAAVVAQFAADPAAFGRDYGRTALILSGPIGTFKTGMCVAAVSAFDAVATLGSVRYVNWLALLTRIQASYNEGVETKRAILESLSAATVLVLDDFGTSSERRASQATIDVAEELIAARYTGAGWLLITTNLTFAELRAEFGPRVASRLSEMAVWLDVDGPDARPSAAAHAVAASAAANG